MARILVIDDEKPIRDILRQVLERDGHFVIEAGDGDEGMREFNKHKPELVITDLVMPEREGLETIMEIRNQYPEIKIIAISGGGQLGNLSFLTAAKRFGASRTVAKPFTPAQIIQAVNEVLAK